MKKKFFLIFKDLKYQAMTNKTDKPLATFIKKKKVRAQIKN